MQMIFVCYPLTNKPKNNNFQQRKRPCKIYYLHQYFNLQGVMMSNIISLRFTPIHLHVAEVNHIRIYN